MGANEINGKRIFSLFEVTKSIEKTITNRYQSSFWVKAEMNKLNFYKRSGHCYPELVEKKEGKVVAQISAILWKSDYQRANANFKRILKEPLKDGIKILFSATIHFNSKYGLTLQISDIDASFTLGDLEKEKQDTIKKLQIDGIYTKNKQLKLPVLAQRIAVISVETSKGYADFLNILESVNTGWNYTFFQMLFPSLLQGDNAVKTILTQLQRIKKVIHHFDVVAIVRGGGGDIGLSCYNDYNLAKEIAEFPIPVITGIGHSTNKTVVELIAHENAITPTKLAEFLIQKFHDFSISVQKSEEKLGNQSRRIIRDAQINFTLEVKLLRSVTQIILDANKNTIAQHIHFLFHQSNFRIGDEQKLLNTTRSYLEKATRQSCADEKQQLSRFCINLGREVEEKIKYTSFHLRNLEKNLDNLRPENILKRGYSITHLNGTSVRTSKTLTEGDSITTIFDKGSVSSTVTSTDEA